MPPLSQSTSWTIHSRGPSSLPFIFAIAHINTNPQPNLANAIYVSPGFLRTFLCVFLQFAGDLFYKESALRDVSEFPDQQTSKPAGKPPDLDSDWDIYGPLPRIGMET